MSSEGTLGELLAYYRVLAGLSQEKLAELAGASASTVSDIERGVSRVPRPATLRALADVSHSSRTSAVGCWPPPGAGRLRRERISSLKTSHARGRRPCRTGWAPHWPSCGRVPGYPSMNSPE